MHDRAALEAAARAWMAHDPDPETRAATQVMLDDPDPTPLARHFGTRLEFGTAGLRGPIGPGPGGMNVAVVRGVTAALARWLDGAPGPVIIGYDGRIGSDRLAAEAAAVIAGAGREVFLHDAVCPTPELAFGVRALGCAAGVMVTASHNPPADNGYKVYAADGAQILPDPAAEIAAAWEAIGIPEAPPDLGPMRAAGRVRAVPVQVGRAWLQALLELRVHPDAGAVGLKVVYTAMHGVGTARTLELLGAAGHRDVAIVEEQAWPDGRFPTVSFPNPEEPGALDLALALADRIGAQLVIANDPDADRLAVAVPSGSGWRALSGNELGWLLADDLLAHGPTDRPRCVGTTIVSSAMLGRIAAAHGATHVETLTGFKWLGHAGAAFERTGGRFVLGYEEAIGYAAGGVTRDKDGVSAALLAVDLAAWLHGRGETLIDRIDALHRQHGVHVADADSLRFDGADASERMAAITAALRDDPPTTLGGSPVLRIRDLERRVARDLRTGATTPIDLPASDVLAFDLADGRVLVRPSGTEPKLKRYYEVVVPAGDDLDAARAEGRARIARIRADLSR